MKRLSFLKAYLFQHKRVIILSGLTTFITTLLLVVLYTYHYAKLPSSNLFSPASSVSENFPLPQNWKHLGIIFLGYGGEGHDGGFLTDAIQLFYLDLEKKKVALISVPRDLWVKTNNKESKINSVFVSQGASGLKKLINQITGLEMNYYVAVDFVGFMRTIGIELKGIDVEVAEVLDDPWYPIAGEEVNSCGKTPEEIEELSQNYSGFELEKQFPCRYEHIHFEKGLSHMEGGEALKYIRSRHGSAEGDISRGRRQQEVIIAIFQKLLSLDVLSNFPDIYTQLAQHVKTDVDLETAKTLLPLLSDSKEFDLKIINLTTKNVLTTSQSDNKQAILISKEGIDNWSNVQAFINEQVLK